MTTLIEQNLPYKIYSAINLGSNEGLFYLGKVPNNQSSNQKTFSDNFYQNCFSGYYFSIASLVPGSCVRMDIADETDPNILIDAKWYDFRPCSSNTCDVKYWPSDNSLYTINYNGLKTEPMFKSFATDGSVVISGLESGFIWNDEGIQGGNDTSHCTIYLQAWKYKFTNVCGDGGLGGYYATMGTPGASDVTFLMKSIIGGFGIKVRDLGTSLIVDFIGCGKQPPPPTVTCEPYIPPSVGEFI